ncbi:cytochrome C oxidase subunit III [Bacillus hominis]|uniref:cytochrome C oxidase subunit III n=1 Tax=Bacillus hominis TaxID=2817478 RepID=UPI00259FF2AF|nr:cytochrome C oxidase subunit III [Bacillus hominis]MDM5192579.1 cytochrome C oxidase subunit III [Bacillus hominis]
MFAVSNNPRPNSYDLQQWYYLQQQEQQQAYQEQLQQQGFVKKKGCNCGKKKI